MTLFQDRPDDSYWGVRAAVLGGTGFIGRWVAAKLVAQGARVYMIVRDQKAADEVCRDFDIRAEIIERDLSDRESLYGFFAKIRPSITFNLAGYGVDQTERDEETAYQVNAELVMAICEAIAGSRDSKWDGGDIIHVGSAAEYGAINGDLHENSVPNPTTLYGRTKLAGTGFLTRCSHAFGIKGVTARLFTVYGPGEHPGRLLPSLIHAARTGEPLPMTTGEQQRDFTYVEDVAEGLLRLGRAATRPGEVVNLATGRLASVRHFAHTAAEILHIPSDRLRFASLPVRSGEMKHNEVNIARLNQLLQWVPATSIEEGIQKTVNFNARAIGGDVRLVEIDHRDAGQALGA